MSENELRNGPGKVSTKSVTGGVFLQSQQTKFNSEQELNISDSQVPKDSRNQVSTNAVVSYQQGPETRNATGTPLSSDTTKVTVRSVNSPQDACGVLAKGLDVRDTRENMMTTSYEYIPVNHSTEDGVISTNGIHYLKIVGNCPDDAASGADMRFNDYGRAKTTKETYGSEFVYEPKHRFSSGSSNLVRTTVKEPHYDGPYRYVKMAPPTNSNERKSSNSFKMSLPEVNLLPGSSTDTITRRRGGSGRDKNRTNLKYSAEEVDYTGLTNHGNMDQYGTPPPFITRTNRNSRLLEQMGRSRKTNEFTRKEAHFLPRYHSMDSSRRIYNPPEYQGVQHTWDYLDPVEPEDVIIVGDDSHLYVENEAQYYRDRSRFYRGQGSEADTADDIDDLDLDVLSHDETSDGEVFVDRAGDYGGYTPRYGGKLGRRFTVLSQNDFKETVPIYTPRRRGSESAVTSLRHDRSHQRKRRLVRPIIVRSYSSDFDREDFDKLLRNFGTSKRKTRQKKNDSSSENQNYMPSVISDNAPIPQSLSLMPQSSINTNLALYPGLGLSSSLPNPYIGFPYSTTPGHMDYLLRNNNLSLVGLRSYLDAMNTSLANIPVPTINSVPYPAPLQQQHSLDTLENVEMQEFFRQTNPIVPVTQPTQSSFSRPPETNTGQLPSNSASSRSEPPSFVSNHRPNQVGDREQFSAPSTWKSGKERQEVGDLETKPSKATRQIVNSKSHDTSDRAPNIASGRAGQYKTPPEDVDTTQRILNSVKRQFSSESNSGDTNNPSPKVQTTKNSSAQTEFSQLNFAPRIPAPPQPSLTKQTCVPSAPESRGIHLIRSSSRDNHTQTVKSPPPLPQLKHSYRTEKLTSPEPDSTQKPTNVSATCDQLRNSPVTQKTNDSYILQQPGTNFFAISNVTVVELPEKNDSNSPLHHTNTHSVKQKAAEFNSLANGNVEKYSITQINSPDVASIHPEAEFVYPLRKHTTKSQLASLHTDKSEKNRGYQSTEKTSAGLQTESDTSYHQNRKVLFAQTKHDSSFSSTPSEPERIHQALLTQDQRSYRSPPGQRESHWSTVDNDMKSAKYPTDLLASPVLPSKSRGSSKMPRPSSLKAPDSINNPQFQSPKVSNELQPHSAASQDSRDIRTSPHMLPSRKTELPDVDVRDIPYQFYQGNPSLLSPATNKHEYMRAVPLYSAPSNTTQSVVTGTDRHKTTQPDSSPTTDLVHPGGKAISRDQQHPTLRVTGLSCVSSKSARKDDDTESAAIVSQNDNDTKDKVAASGHAKVKIPIPPRDFDSDADSSEFIYTSQGWSSINHTPTSATVSFCAGVQDNSARYVAKYYERFHRQDVSMHSSDKTYTDNLKHAESSHIFSPAHLFDVQFLKKRSTFDQSLKRNKDMRMDYAPMKKDKPLLFRGFQDGPANLESYDPDSGVSSASQNSTVILQDFDYHDSHASLAPDYSSVSSNVSSSSLELGCDYLSCRDSLQRKNVETRSCQERRDETRPKQ